MLLGLIVTIAILLLWLSVAATHEAFAIRREREAETARRADQYVRAIRRYYLKFGHYPGSIEQLEQTNNMRFLRRRWIDPLTGSNEWRTIAVGQNKTTPRGFFGEPLAGLPTSGLGTPIGSQPQATPGTTPSPATASSAGLNGPVTPPSSSPAPFASAPGTSGFTFGSPGSGSPGLGTAGPGTVGLAAPGTSGANGAAAATGTPASPANPSGATQLGAPNPAGNTSGFGGQGIGGAFMGVGTKATGSSILEVNGQGAYQDWEFLYDPRVEQLRRSQQLNAGRSTADAGSLGQSPSSPGGSGQPSTPGQPAPSGAGQPAGPTGGFGLPTNPATPAAPTPTPPASSPDSSQPAPPTIGAPLRP